MPAAEVPSRPRGVLSEAAYKLTALNLPDKFFRELEEPPEDRFPKGPARVLFLSFYAELAVCFGVLIFFVTYFATLTTPNTSIGSTIQPGQVCIALNPKRGTTYYSKDTSENGQFASLSKSSADCVAYLEGLDVCKDGNRRDIVQVVGPTITENMKLFKSATSYSRPRPSRPRS